MKTLQQVKEMYVSQTLDGRDISRLTYFIPENELTAWGIELKEEYVGRHVAKEWTKENIINQLKMDVDFGFEKALNKRGISSSFMHDVVCMWNWILEEGLEKFGEDNYAQYGLPTFKATALKYGFENPIGDDSGDEYKYSSESREDY